MTNNDRLSQLSDLTYGVPACDRPGKVLEDLLQETTLAEPDRNKLGRLGVGTICETLLMMRRLDYAPGAIERMITAELDRMLAEAKNKE